MGHGWRRMLDRGAGRSAKPGASEAVTALLRQPSGLDLHKRRPGGVQFDPASFRSARTLSSSVVVEAARRGVADPRVVLVQYLVGKAVGGLPGLGLFQLPGNPDSSRQPPAYPCRHGWRRRELLAPSTPPHRLPQRSASTFVHLPRMAELVRPYPAARAQSSANGRSCGKRRTTPRSPATSPTQYVAQKAASVSASKFTAEVRGELIERTGLGLSLADACRSVGVREATVKGWLTRGRREGSGDYAEFRSGHRTGPRGSA